MSRVNMLLIAPVKMLVLAKELVPQLAPTLKSKTHSFLRPAENIQTVSA